MKLKQLDAFLMVAEHRTIRGAARALGVTQPAISSIVREPNRSSAYRSSCAA